MLDEWWIYDADCLPPGLNAAKTKSDPMILDVAKYDLVKIAAGVTEK